MFVSIGEAANMLGVHTQTLRRWEGEGKFSSSFRTAGGHRRYKLTDIRIVVGEQVNETQAEPVAYARVSSFDQKQDLERQKKRLEKWSQKKFGSVTLLSDLGSGVNFKKSGLTKLVRLILQGRVSDLVLTHKDRLLRFGNELLFLIAEHFGVKVHIIEEEKERPSEVVFAEDVLCLMTVFSARLYGIRSHQNRKKKAA